MKKETCAYCMKGELMDKFGYLAFETETSQVIVFKDQSHPGRMIVAYKKDHVAEIKDLSIAERNAFMEDVCKVANAIQKAYNKFDGIVINPGAYTHTSVALLDAVKSVGIPTVEVHISDVSSREDFRQISYIRSACVATVSGKGFDGYNEAIDILMVKKW